ncbi:hypothetical protein OG203_06990 [Nocardia sp. NBC_01499]|uniref:hypothetical protein n=1 Tax=Nocardia sp. NBC_01499 TaxID=2903597 RepID=UPI003868E6F2
MRVAELPVYARVASAKDVLRQKRWGRGSGNGLDTSADHPHVRVYCRPILGALAALLLMILALFLMPTNEPPVPANDQQVRILPFMPTPPTTTVGGMPSAPSDQPEPGRQ